MALHRALTIAAVCGLGVIWGCTRYGEYKALKDEPGFSEEKVTAAVLRSGDEVRFNDNGGKVGFSFIISGTSTDGRKVRIHSYDVDEMRSTSPRFLPLSEATKDYRITEMLTNGGRLVRYGSRGAIVKSGKVVGLDEAPMSLEYPVSSVVGVRFGITAPLRPEVVAHDANLRIAEIVMIRDERLILFDSSGGRADSSVEAIYGMDSRGDPIGIALDSILYARVQRVDALKTFVVSIGAVCLVTAATVAIVVAVKQSCPFIYSYDGTRYVFDAEPLGGATTAGLARTDYSRLESLRPIDGRYRLLVRNEVDETQYIDGMRLLYVDHAASLTPVAEGGGFVQLIGKTSSPVEGTDEHGTDLKNFVSAKDGIAWETHMESFHAAFPDSARHTLTFKFTRPRSARRAILVVHGGTTLWGSNMIRAMHELRGKNVDRWYAEADRKGPALYELLTWLDREEIYALKLSAWKGGRWKEAGTIFGGGPLIHETQCVPIALSGVEGDTLVLRMRPPAGFWSFDQLAVTFEAETHAPLTPLPMLAATEHTGRSVADLLDSQDGKYLVMPDNGNQTALEFAAPPPQPGLQRSLFVETDGYYRLHLKKEGPEDLKTIGWLGAQPGAIVQFSFTKYTEWRKTLRTLASSSLN